MMQQLCANTERSSATAARVVDDASAMLGFTTTGTTFAWNAKPSVHVHAIRTYGKRYERRPQEMLT